MNIFAEIEGLSGENLGSALLRYLIFNSQEVREEFISLLSKSSPIGPLSYLTHFSCRTEYPTTDETLGNGRLDLLIQLDDVVIGIENKFLAQFQEKQPEKYLGTLNDVAIALGGINQTTVKAILYVLCPESRVREAREKITGLPDVEVVTWEKVISKFSKINEVSNPTAKIILQEFIKYLTQHFSFIPDFKQKAPHLIKPFVPRGSALQGEVVGKLWDLFPYPGGRLSNGNSWIGYNFFMDTVTDEKGWFGFVPTQQLLGRTESGSSLVIVTTFNPSLSNSFERVQLINDNFIGAPGRTNTWIVNFDSSWDSVDIWRRELAPMWDAVNSEA